MATERERDYCLNFDLISIICCDCYEDYWKNLRKSEESFKELDYSIEKKKTFRKFFSEEKTLFHCCVDCFKKVFFNHRDDFSVINVGDYFRFGQYNKHWTAEYSCLADILEGKSTDIGKTCSGCVGKVMSNFKSDFKNV